MVERICSVSDPNLESLDADSLDLDIDSLDLTPLERPTNIAIIGGGIAGISIAYELRNRKSATWCPEVTLFERDDRLGGRIHSVFKYDEGREVVEAGAASFWWEDWRLRRLFQEAGVELVDPHGRKIRDEPQSRSVGIFDERAIVASKLSGPETWTHFAKLVWRHRWSGWFWLRLCIQFVSIARESRYWRDWRQIFSHAADKAAAAVNPYEDEVTRFAAKYGLSSRPQVSAEGGNERALRRLALLSQATVHLRSTVTDINVLGEQDFDISWTRATDKGTEERHTAHFDAVIIAAPFSQTGIAISPPHLQPAESASVEYTPLHVTHFISRYHIDPAAFNLSATESIPDEIWNLNPNPNAQSTQDKDQLPLAGPTPFLTLTRAPSFWIAGCCGDTENLYRITSTKPFTDADIARLCLPAFPETVTFPHQSRYIPSFDAHAELNQPNPRFRGVRVFDGGRVHDEGWYLRHRGCTPAPRVRWVHRQVWENGVPVVRRGQKAGGGGGNWAEVRARERAAMRLIAGLFYVSGFEASKGASLAGSVWAGKEVVDLLCCRCGRC
ncbi:FAD/NAD(P)-binding domain-containing protein [Aspergillus aculeatinus CBS 121060]|uniref:FAD/NAD(P)-binding domain-containing protein n=1 Tax=Aspergillus aculeatinus CBS 121060 TaxID=1448322 RepID=A0ACD1H260_9EURO|nr:FAD/NAD(P)-binding domain-containing protein [Aspergillus aculeatinus CBS 121060]RAH67831.1 FAD/NAD(P)-binding domain-containing protein [Aspergillus aculeatinus CBS 121060]